MRSRRLLNLAGIAALAAMLFTQAAFALAACESARASSRATMLATPAEEAGCHQPADNGNLCMMHCQGREQTLDKHQVKVPDVSLQPVRIGQAAENIPQPLLWSVRLPLPAAGPPPHILYRSLLL